MNTITVSELKDLKNPLIIDIRDNFNYNNSHIPSAINIPELILKEMPTRYLSKFKVSGQTNEVNNAFINDIQIKCVN